MSLYILIGVLFAAASPSGELAYIDTGAGTGGAVAVVAAAGGEGRNLGPGRRDGVPRWSPDGIWLAFESGTPAGGRGIFVVRHDGAEGRFIGDPDLWNTGPGWSPDGRRIIYVSAGARGAPGQLRVHDLNTGEDQVWGGGRTGMAIPQWLPFTALLQSLNPDAAPEIGGVPLAGLVAEARMSLEELQEDVLPEAAVAMMLTPVTTEDGLGVASEIVLVTRTYVLPLMALPDLAETRADALVWGVTANWSGARLAPTSGPRYGAYSMEKTGSSTRVAFESNAGGDREIYVLGKRGIANVSNHRSADWAPVWSPDGKMLAFESFRGGRRGIYTVYADTAHVSAVTAPDGADCWSPAWSQDGEFIAYVSDATGRAELYIIDVEEGETQPVPAGGGNKEAPAWRPTIE